ncbi:MAG: alpha-ketoglutarate-dependent dioxygenase AlkB [Caldimonas sp.]
MTDPLEQLSLFDNGRPASLEPALPDGWRYEPFFLDATEEADALAIVADLDLHEARYKGYTARRRVAHFGTAYDYDDNRLLPGPLLPDSLRPLRDKAAAWAGLPPLALTSALVAEYRPGVPLGWHRDVPDFETVVGISLLGSARMRFRRYPPVQPKKADVISLALAPRSAYVLRAEARWGWQHSIAPTPELRYSITFRERREGTMQMPAVP